MTVASKPHALAAPVALTFRRSRHADPAALGGRWVGAADTALQAPLLAPESAVFDAWLGGGAASERRRHGSVRYATDGRWLHGCIEIDDGPIGLQEASLRAYRELFEVVAANDCPQLLRLWNYIADINGESDGIERYRQFNAGRQQAFLDARRSAFDGAPAACALGTQRGPLHVSFLAGRQAPLAIENPRQVSAYRYPAAYGPRSPTFSRAALADAGGGRRLLLISGTASIVGHATMHVGDLRRQTEESLENLAAVRAAAAQRAGVDFPADAFTYTVYVRRAADLGAVRELFERAVGASSAAARECVYLQADICRAELLVEIEAHAFVDAGSGA